MADDINKQQVERIDLLTAALEAVILYCVDAKGFMTHEQQEILRFARSLLKKG